jgi:hypothetical protein
VTVKKMSAFAKRYGGRCGSSSVGRASASQAEGREFEPRFPLKVKDLGEWVTSGLRNQGASLRLT